MSPRLVLAVATALLASPAYGRPLRQLPDAIPPLNSVATQPGIDGNCPGGTGMLTFGGTFWSADSLRWEALQDSVWTFETGAGSHFQHAGTCKDTTLHASMEGWVGLDMSRKGEGRFRRLGTGDFGATVCVGTTVGLGGNMSLWAGLTEGEADSACYAAGQGYGSNWYTSISKVFSYDGSDTLVLRFDYRVHAEPGYDFGHVVVDTSCAADGSGEIELASYTGHTVPPPVLPERLILSRGVNLPSAPGCVTIRFRFTSDPSYDDQDGAYQTACGGFAVDNVRVSTVPWGGSLSEFSDFEAGADGWTEDPFPLCGPGGEFARLKSLSDLDPLPSPACQLADSVLVFFDPAVNGHVLGIADVALSPWIDLKAAGAESWTSKTVTFDARNNPEYPAAAITVVSQYHPDPCTGAVSELSQPLFFQEVDDTCISFVVDLSQQIPVGAEQVRIGLGVTELCDVFGVPCAPTTTGSSPWIDNVRFYVWECNVVGVPDAPPRPVAGLHAAPNPFTGPVSLFLIRPPELAAAPAAVTVFDLAGRIVREFEVPSGQAAAEWDGADGGGHPVAPGIYFVRARAGGWSASGKIVKSR